MKTEYKKEFAGTSKIFKVLARKAENMGAIIIFNPNHNYSALRIKVKTTEILTDGDWVGFAHELGHFVEYKKGKLPASPMFCSDVEVYQHEKIAWDLGWNILDQLGFSDDIFFNKYCAERDTCLNNYKSYLSLA